MSAPEIPPVEARWTGYPRRPGNRVRAWIDGVPFYTRLLEALRGARERVWTTVSFIHRAFVFPGGGDLWEELNACARRGVDVRLLCWHNARFVKTSSLFLGGPEERGFLAERGVRARVRWDRSPEPAHCHHQKAWVVDDTGFVGGMVLTVPTLTTPEHPEAGESKHDSFLELRGPSTLDVAHNFVQRWNEADPGDVLPWPSAEEAGPIAWAPELPAPCGDAQVQVARTVAPGLYREPIDLPGGSPFDPSGGEDAIWRQLLAAFAAARRTIYIESQHPGEERLLAALDDALARGVQVVYLVPGEPMQAIRHAKRAADRSAAGGPSTRYAATFAALGALGRHPDFTLAALATSRAEVYVHSKLCVVDGVWLSCGSANLVDLSLRPDHTELNAAVWDPEVALGLLRTLASEHLERDCSTLDDAAVLASLQAAARANAERRGRGAPGVGRPYAIDPAVYGAHAGPG